MARIWDAARGIVPDLRAAPVGDTVDIAPDARAIAPVLWLLGKVQSGKSSIIRTVTGSTVAEVGSGFKPCTRTSQVFDFPAEVPILRFLDTRGLGEIAYDPSDDMQFAEAASHLLLVTMRATDPRQTTIVEAVKTVRRRHPEWPVVVAQTCLHEGYTPGAGHALPYPFGARDDAGATPSAIPLDLARSLAFQRGLFAGLPGSGPVVFVPIDFTIPGDGLEPTDYGLDALAEALVGVAPHAMAVALSVIPAVAQDRFAATAKPVVLGHAMVAAGGDLVPVAGAVAVSAVQAQMLRRLGQLYGVAWDRRTMTEFGAALGGGLVSKTLTGLGLRQLAKLIPVYGQTAATAASAAMSFAVTYALGQAAIYFLHRRRLGLSAEGVAATYQQSLREALKLAKARNSKSNPEERRP